MPHCSSLISVKELTISFDENPYVLDGISLDIQEGEIFALLGPNGCGKSVFLKCIAGLLPVDKGSVLVKGTDITYMDFTERQRTLAPFGMLFQNNALFDSLTIAENIMYGILSKTNEVNDEEMLTVVEKLNFVGLDASVANLYPDELSGGMNKRVALARTLANMPRLVFFDDPTTGLDPILTRTLDQFIVSYIKMMHVSAILVTHDLESVRKIADRVGLMFKGKIIWTGTIQEMDETEDPYVYQFVRGLSQGPYTN
ncbi:MAG: ATP-binding cassette domain-containing protein [Pseudomonadota bacterium]